MMSAKEKSDQPEVAKKRANKAVSAAAELVERRGGAKENAELQSTVRTQSREAVSQAQNRIREAMPQRSRTAGACQRLAKVMRSLGWSAI
jgi:RNA-directed DNA polymerase